MSSIDFDKGSGSRPDLENAGRGVEAPIPVLRPLLPTIDQVLPYLKRIDCSRTYSNFGPLSLEFQTRLADILKSGDNSVICTSSGTSALMGAILACAGAATASRPFALIPGFTFAATAAAAERCGYKPYFVDIDPETWQLNPEALTEHPRLREVGIVIPVAPFGLPVRQEPWMRFRAKTGIPVVIDGAASFSLVSEKPEEFIGEIAVAISFHATKSFAVGEGGCVVWANVNGNKLLCRAINFGFYDSRTSVAPSLNGKMSEYHAAVGLAELDNWPSKVRALKKVAHLYRTAFARTRVDLELILYPQVDFVYPLLSSADRAGSRAMQHALTEAGVGTRFWYGKGMSAHPQFRKSEHDKLYLSTALTARLLGLPMAPDLTEAHIDKIVGVIAGSGQQRRPNSPHSPQIAGLRTG